MTKRQTDVDKGRNNRQRIVDLINEQGSGKIRCSFLGETKEFGQAIRVSLEDDLETNIICDFRLKESTTKLGNYTYYKGSQDLIENIEEIEKRYFIIIAEGRYCILSGKKLAEDLKRFKQNTTKGNKNRTDIFIGNFKPDIPLKGGGFFDQPNLAESLFRILMRL